MRFTTSSSVFFLMRLLLINSAPIPDQELAASVASASTVQVTDDHSFVTGRMDKAEDPNAHVEIGSSAPSDSQCSADMGPSFSSGQYTNSTLTPTPDQEPAASVANSRALVVIDDHSFVTGRMDKAEDPNRHVEIGITAHPGSPYSADMGLSFSSGQFTRACKYANGALRPVTLRYAIVLDAGSSSTKTQNYKLEYCGDSFYAIFNDTLEVAEGPKPPRKVSDLATSADNESELAGNATIYVKSVLDFARAKSTPGKENETVLALMATAGMRLIDEDKVNKVMMAVSKALVAYRDQLCAEQGLCYIIPSNNPAARVISGAEEGVWSWMTANIFEHKIGYQSPPVERDPETPLTTAIMDVGGASTQLVYEITPGDVKNLTELYPGFLNPLHTVLFEGQSYPLFQQSFLYFGNDQIRLRIGSKYYEVADGIAKNATGYTAKYFTKEKMIENDYIDFNDISRFICLHDNLERKTDFKGINLKGRITSETRNASAPCQYWVKMAFQPDGYGPHLNATPSTYYPCMGTLHRSPKIRGFNTLTHFARRFVGDDAQTVSMDTLTEIREWVCDKKAPQGNKTFRESNEFFSCQEAVYMEMLFRDSYKLPADVDVDVSLEVDHKGIGWTLGAALSMISAVDYAA